MAGPTIYRSRYPEPVVPARSLAAFTLEQAGWRPDCLALVDGGTGATWSYGQLLDGVTRASRRLRASGVGPGDRVGLSAPNQPGWVVAFYGALAAGATVVPLNPALLPAELGPLLALARPSLVVADPQGMGALEQCPASSAPLLALDVLVAPDRLEDGAAGEADSAWQQWQEPAAEPGRVAVIAFSSGTSGRAKGVQLTHGNLIAAIVQHEEVYHIGPADTVVAAMPFFHIYGMSILLGYALRHGATVVTMPRFDADAYCRLVAAHRVTWLHLVPPMVLALVRRAGGTDDLSSVRHAVSGAAPLDAALAAQAAALLGCPVGQGYGMTEASPGVTWVPDDGSVACGEGSVGLLVAGTEARLVDPVTGEDADGAGELWVRGPQVMKGYLDDPAATAAVLTDDGWLRTGDVLRVDEDGVWWVVDRVKELIKYKGWQVAPAELEAVLLEHPLVVDAAVAGVADADAGEVPVAWVVTAGPVAPHVLVEWVAARVAPYKKVRRIHLVDKVPRSPSGKVLRRTLVEPPSGCS